MRPCGETSPAFLHGFTLVVASQLDPSTLDAVAAQCWERRIPLMALKVCGYLGSVRLQLRDHEVGARETNITAAGLGRTGQ